VDSLRTSEGHSRRENLSGGHRKRGERWNGRGHQRQDEKAE